MKERERKAKEIVPGKEQLVSDFLVEDDVLNMIDRKPQPKKPENKFYKGSDEQGDIGEVELKEKHHTRFKRNVKGHNAEKNEEDINAVGKDINTKKADKKALER